MMNIEINITFKQIDFTYIACCFIKFKTLRFVLNKIALGSVLLYILVHLYFFLPMNLN